MRSSTIELVPRMEFRVLHLEDTLEPLTEFDDYCQMLVAFHAACKYYNPSDFYLDVDDFHFIETKGYNVESPKPRCDEKILKVYGTSALYIIVVANGLSFGQFPIPYCSVDSNRPIQHTAKVAFINHDDDRP